MKLNWAKYVEWTNAKKFRQMTVKGLVCENRFEDFFDGGEHFEYDKAHAQEVNEHGLIVLMTLQTYLLFLQKLFTNVKQVLVTKNKGKKNMVLANVRACSQMEDRRN